MIYNKDDNTVTISFDYFIELQSASDELLQLEGAGVDNWEGYGEGYDETKSNIVEGLNLSEDEIEELTIKSANELYYKHAFGLTD